MAVKSGKKEPDPKPYHHGDLRRALIDAALKLLAEGDLSEVTLREVARRAGVTHAAPYRHFPDKQALLCAVAEEGFRGMHALMVERQGKASGARDRLIALGVAYVDFAVTHPAHFRLMFRKSVDGNPTPALTEAMSALFDLLEGGVREAQTAGVVRTNTRAPLPLACWSVTHGLAMLFVEGQFAFLDIPDERAHAVAQALCNTLFDGLAV